MCACVSVLVSVLVFACVLVIVWVCLCACVCLRVLVYAFLFVHVYMLVCLCCPAARLFLILFLFGLFRPKTGRWSECAVAQQARIRLVLLTAADRAQHRIAAEMDVAASQQEEVCLCEQLMHYYTTHALIATTMDTYTHARSFYSQRLTALITKSPLRVMH